MIIEVTFLSVHHKNKFLGTHYIAYEPRCEKTGLRGFRPGPTHTGLYSLEDG